MAEKEKERAFQVLLRKIEQFCVYRDRSIKEVQERLSEYGAEADDMENAIASLLEENLINEDRFASNFAVGKHRSRNWGRIKIRYELRKKGLEEHAISSGLKSIDPDEYVETLEQLLEKKNRELKESNYSIRKKKLADHLIRKGYESDLVWSAISDLKKDQ